MPQSYDAIVVGARCAGAPTAMLLARSGHRVLLVDRATFPSDTVSTHVVHAPGVAALERWGLRDAVAASGCPPIRRYSFDFGPFVITGAPRAAGGVDEAYCPRRTVLDAMLVEAAAEAGAEVREGFSVEEVLIDGGAVVGIRGKDAGGRAVTEHAATVIGADGRNSLVAKAVDPQQYNEKPAVSPAFYSYWSGVGSSGFEVYVRERCGMAAFPTHDDLTLVIVGLPEEDFAAARSDVENSFLRAVERAPVLAERIGSGNARGTVPRRDRPRRVLPQALWTWLGARRRRGLPPPSDHRAGNHRRVLGRRAPRSCAHRRHGRAKQQRRRDGPLSNRARSTTRSPCTR